MTDSSHASSADDRGSLSAQLRREDALDAFESAWRTGQRPDLNVFLCSVPEASRPPLFCELLSLELGYRREAGETPQVSDYLAKFPQFAVQVRQCVTTAAAPKPRAAASLKIRCPHCHNPIDVVDDDPSGDVSCPSCGSCFNLAKDVETGRHLGAGRMLGHFQLLDRLGQGAFGEVWKARDTKLDRIVAIKIPRRQYLTEAETEQFLREARSAAQVRHPNIVSVHEVGREDGRIYIASDFIDGASLDEWVQAHPLTVRESVELCATIAEALHQAHEAGIVHRDLKPQNILVQLAELQKPDSSVRTPQTDVQGRKEAEEETVLFLDLAGQPPASRDAAPLAQQSSTISGRASRRTSQPESLIPYITDFGLAKRDAGEITMTVEGAILGTPAYMPPEQARGEAHHADRRSDVYSLGVILFRLLTGELPFRGQRQMLLHQILNEEPPAPRKLDARIPRDVETICLKCLEKDPIRRYQSAAAFAADLRRWLTGHPVEARPVSRTERAWRWCNRNPLVARLWLSVAVSLLVGTTISIYFAISERITAKDEAEQRSKADAQTIIAKAETRRAKNALLDMHFERASVFREHGETREVVATYAYIADSAEPGDWRATSAQNLLEGWMTIHSHSFPDITRLLFLPDAKTVLTENSNGKLQLWDARTGSPIGQPLRDHWFWGAQVLSHDKLLVVTSRPDGMIQMWDATTMTPRGKPISPPKPISLPERFRSILANNDSETLLIISEDSSSKMIVRLWDLNSGAFRAALPPQDSLDHHTRFSPDGRTVLTCDHQGKRSGPTMPAVVRLWNTRTGEAQGEPMHHPDRVHAISFSPNGDAIVTGCGDKVARLWDARTSQPLGMPMRHDGWVSYALFSPDGETILTGSVEDKSVRLWDARTCAARGEPMMHEEYLRGIAYGPDGQTIAVRGTGSTVWIWDAWTGKRRGATLQHKGPVTDLLLSPDGQSVLTSSEDNTARLWSAWTGEPLGGPLHHARNIEMIAFAPNGQQILTQCNNVARMWHFTDYMVRGDVKLRRMAYKAKFSPDGKTVVTTHGDGDIRTEAWISDALTGQTITVLRHRFAVDSVAFSPDGETIVTGNSDLATRTEGEIRLWNVRTGEAIGKPMFHKARVMSVAFSPDGQTLLTGSDDGTARLWNPRTCEPRSEPLPQNGSVHAVRFSHDGKKMLIGVFSGLLRVWDVSSRTVIGTSIQHPSLLDAEFSPDDQYVVTGGLDRTVRLWNVRTGEPRCKPLLHGDAVLVVSFSPDGRTVLSGAADKTARMWDAQTGEPMGQPLTHESSVQAIAFSEDGKFAQTFTAYRSFLWNVYCEVPNDRVLRRVWVEWKTGYSFDDVGKLQPLSDEERVARWRTIQKDGVDERTAYSDPVIGHQTQAAESERNGRWFAACFHLHRLRNLLPDDETIQRRLAQAETEWTKQDAKWRIQSLLH